MKIENFCCVAAELQNKLTGTTKMSQIYFYRAYEEETLDEMLTAGFFNNLQDRIKKDDIILLYYPNTNGDSQLAWVKVVSNIGGIVTIEQISSDDAELAEEVAEIQAKIPSSASSSNKLVDNSSLTTALSSKQNVLTSDNAGTNITITTVGGVVKINSSGGGGGSTDWGDIGGNLPDQTDLQNALNAKQDTLVSGTNIKTINGNSVLGSGDLEIKSGSSRNVGEIIESALPLTDAGLHLLDGSLILGGGIYDGFVQYIADLYAEGPTANYWTTEANWQSAVSTYGVCGKFVYDSVNNTVRLPKITGIIEGTTDLTALGDLVEAGLPNITGEFDADEITHGSTSTVSGAFYSKSSTYPNSGTGTSGSALAIGFDASRSDSTYGNSNTVQPQTIKVLYYIVVATATKTEIEVDIDQIVTDLNGKADIDLSNINASPSAKSEIVSWLGLDSNSAVTVTTTNAATYTCPADGCLYLFCYGGSGTAYLAYSSSLATYRTNVYTCLALSSSSGTQSGFYPVRKGEVLTCTYSTGSTREAWFIPYIGG